MHNVHKGHNVHRIQKRKGPHAARQEGSLVTDVSAASYRHVQGLSRGLSLLHELSRSPQGWATIVELSARTGLHRTTVRRLLETLQTEGYVRRSRSDDSYRLSPKIRQLSDGFTDDEWISEVANPVLGELLQRLVWPSDLCTLDGDCMLVRETTHRFSPLSFHRAMIRQRMPLLLTASGRAYLAFCDPQQREQILGLLASGTDAQSALARNRVLVDPLLERIRAQGYATNDGEWSMQQQISAIAMPIRFQNQPLATLSVVFLRKAMGVQDAARRYLPELQAAIAKIEDRLNRDASLVPSTLGA